MNIHKKLRTRLQRKNVKTYFLTDMEIELVSELLSKFKAKYFYAKVDCLLKWEQDASNTKAAMDSYGGYV